MSDQLCIYHGNCADGFGAAYAVWKLLGDDCEYVAGHYGSEPPDVYGKKVYMVDFSYKRPVLLQMAAKAQSIVILDHHDTAEKELVDLPSNVEVLFDQSQSGAVIAWDYFHSGAAPTLLKIVEDRDLWRFKFRATKTVTAALFSYDWTFELWDKWMDERAVHNLAQEGEALLRKHNKDVQALCESHNVDVTVFGKGGLRAPTVNCPWMFASDVGHELCKRYPDALLSATYMIGTDRVKFSLRSDGKVHCGEIAQQFGGGGHPNAAGFSVSHEEFGGAFLESVREKANGNKPGVLPADDGDEG